MSLPSTLSGPQGLLATLEPIRQGVGRFTAQPAVRRSLPAVAMLAIVGAGVAIWLALQAPSLLTLYPGMAEAEKSRVMEVLTGAGIPATLASASGEVQVPEADYHRAKMVLAAQGLPESMPNSEDLLGKLQLGTSRSVESLRLKQAQEVELARSISSIAGVASVRVHLAIPERSAFVRDMQAPGASVVVTLKPGSTLDAGQVDAIVNLVASSVPGMARDQVSVIDHRGNLLSDGGEDEASRLNSRQMQDRAQLENLYRTRIAALLMPLTGPDNLSVQVTLDMDFSATEVQTQEVIPGSATVVNEENQSSETSQPEARGIPGGVSNTPPAAATPGTAQPGQQPPQQAAAPSAPQTQSAASKRTFEVGRRVQTTRPGAPRVLKVSAAVLVGAVEGLDDKAAAARLADMEKLVKGAVGFDDQRGDVVTVLAQPFVQLGDTSPVTVDLAPRQLPAWMRDPLIQLGAVAGTVVLLVLVGAVLLLRRRKVATVAAMPAGAVAAMAVAGAGAPAPVLLPDGTLAPAALAAPDGPAPGEDPAEFELRQRDERRMHLARAAMSAGNRDEKFAILRQIAEEEPSRIAFVLRKMMKDEIDRVI